jgi:uracil-DNA glycosylase
MNYLINKEWDRLLSDEFNKGYFQDIISYLTKEYLNNNIFPKKENIFKAFNLTSFEEIKVVIIGQDPYHGFNQANGLAFSTQELKLPPSLKNIYKELKSDLGIIKVDGDLSDWAKQGVFLLNTILTVEKGKPLSHSKLGWEIFTDQVIKLISTKKEKVIFVLWGNNAIKKETLIDSKHIIIKSVHPSPFSANKGFFGSKPFSKINSHLIKPIEW